MNLTATMDALTWCTTQPHTVDQIVGIYGERQARNGRDYGYGKTNDQLVSALKASDPGAGHGGKGGHADPTPAAALRGTPDAVDDDPTIARITDVCNDIARFATDLDHTVSEALSLTIWNGTTTGLTRTAALTRASTRLHHAQPNLEAARTAWPAAASEMDATVRRLNDDATWLHQKLEAIWSESKGERLTPAVQRAITPCRVHALYGGTEHATPPGDLCARCDDFRRNHSCDPTGPIIKRWEYAKAATPAQVIEAKAAAKPKRKAASGEGR